MGIFYYSRKGEDRDDQMAHGQGKLNLVFPSCAWFSPEEEEEEEEGGGGGGGISKF